MHLWTKVGIMSTDLYTVIASTYPNHSMITEVDSIKLLLSTQ